MAAYETKVRFLEELRVSMYSYFYFPHRNLIISSSHRRKELPTWNPFKKRNSELLCGEQLDQFYSYFEDSFNSL